MVLDLLMYLCIHAYVLAKLLSIKPDLLFSLSLLLKGRPHFRNTHVVHLFGASVLFIRCPCFWVRNVGFQAIFLVGGKNST